MSTAGRGPSPGVAARRAALQAVSRCLAGEFLAPALGAVLDSSGLSGADRSLVTDLAYGTIRRLPQLDERLKPFLKAPGKLPPQVRAVLRLGSYELLFRSTPTYAAVSAWVEVAKREEPALSGLVNAVLRRVAKQTAAQATDASEAALPTWLWERFVVALGPDAARQAALGMLEPEPLWLTAYTHGATELLRADGCDVAPGPRFADLYRAGGAEPNDGDDDTPLPRSLAVRSPLPLDKLRAYRQGLVQPQNPASLYAALLLAAGDGAFDPAAGRAATPAAGDRVLDLAAGRGIKSAALAATGAAVTAVELRPERSRASEENLRRLGLTVEHIVADLSRPPSETLLAALGGPAATVLLDAPCSGTGTLRGNPEIKLRLTAQSVQELAALQASMLDSAAALTAPGGTLLYAVCALTAEEGPEQLTAFLTRHPEFGPLAFTPALPHVPATPGLFVLPVDGLDGFYLCLLRRRKLLL